MDADQGSVDGREIQFNLAEIIFHLNEFFENSSDRSVKGQGMKSLIHRVPITELLGQITPRGSRFENPEDSIDIASFAHKTHRAAVVRSSDKQ